MTAPFYFPMNPAYKIPKFVYITAEMQVVHADIDAENKAKRQAIDGIVTDSLPGYKHRFIYSNGSVIGYKYEKVDSRGNWVDNSWYRELSMLDHWKQLPWSW